VLYYVVLYCVVLCCELCCIVLRVALYCVVLYCVALCCVVLYCDVLCRHRHNIFHVQISIFRSIIYLCPKYFLHKIESTKLVAIASADQVPVQYSHTHHDSQEVWLAIR
jgi:hypothetical protein